MKTQPPQSLPHRHGPQAGLNSINDNEWMDKIALFVSALVICLIIFGVISCISKSDGDYKDNQSYGSGYSNSYYGQWEMLEQMAQLFIQTATINAGLELGVSEEEAFDVARTFKRDVKRSYISGDSAFIIGTFTVKNQKVGYSGKYKKDKSGIWMPVPGEQRVFILNSLDF